MDLENNWSTYIFFCYFACVSCSFCQNFFAGQLNVFIIRIIKTCDVTVLHIIHLFEIGSTYLLLKALYLHFN
jgi:hypothetical protein